jgi:hypothetical protein
MSGRRAKAERRAEREGPANVLAALGTASRMRSIDLSAIPLTRYRQFIVGWLRAAFEQSLAIATLAQADLGYTAAPNKRSFAEIVIRLQWVHGIGQIDRAGALDAMIDEEKKNTEKFFKHLEGMGYKSDVDLSEMKAFVTEVTDDRHIKDQATKLLEAAKATEGQSVGMYYSWRHETQYTHATSALAVAYAPDVENRLGLGHPEAVDPDLETHRLITMLIVTLVYRLLVEDSVDEKLAMTIVDTFFDIGR